MKLKFKQSIATAEVTYNCNVEYEVKDKAQAESFIEAGIADKVVEPKEEKTVDEKPKKRTVKKKEVDEK